jgi:hypothetical protein
MELCRMAGRPMAQAHARSALPAKPPIETGWDRARIKTAKKEAPARRPEPLKFCVLDVPKNSRGNGLVASKQTQITR